MNSYAHLIPELNLPSLYEPQHWLRLLTGAGMGLVMLIALYPVFNQTVWRNWIDRPALSGWRSWAGLFGLALALYLLVLTESPLVLYPLAYLTAGAVLVILIDDVWHFVADDFQAREPLYPPWTACLVPAGWFRHGDGADHRVGYRALPADRYMERNFAGVGLVCSRKRNSTQIPGVE